ILRRVLDRHRHAVADREARLAHGAGRVLAAQVEPFAELARTHRHDDVPARAIERDHDAARRALAPLLDERELIEVEHVDTIFAWVCGSRSVGDTLVEDRMPLEGASR